MDLLGLIKPVLSHHAVVSGLDQLHRPSALPRLRPNTTASDIIQALYENTHLITL